MSGKDLYPLEGVQVPGAAVLVGGFEADGALNPSVFYPDKVRRFTVTKHATTGRWTVTLDQGAFRGVYAAFAQCEPREANSTKRAFVNDSSDLTNGGTFDVRGQSAVGTDANLDGPIIWLWVVLRHTAVGD